MLQYDSYTRDRVRQLVDRLRGKTYRDARPAAELQVSAPTGRITRAEAQTLAYRPAQLGEQFGPQWTTFWFKVPLRGHALGRRPTAPGAQLRTGQR